MLRSFLFLTLFAAISSGCHFGGDRELENAFPRTVELINTSPDEIDLTELSSSLDAKETFILPGEGMSPGGALSWRIRMEAYDDFLSGHFVLYGACGDMSPWERDGATLRQHIIRQEALGTVTIAVPSCAGH